MNTAFPTPTTVQAPCLLDFYKMFHKAAYNRGENGGITEVLINFTGRHGKHNNIANALGNRYMWAGLQGMINFIVVREWGKFFAAPKHEAIDAYVRVNGGGLGRPVDTTSIEALHDLGYLPLEFRSLPEGVAVPYGVPAMTCVNTHDDYYWLPNFIETILSDEVWPVQTALTTATAYMQTTQKFAAIDGTPEFLIPFLCHDFSMRGMMGGTVAGGSSLSGLGHLMSGFVGSDTIPAALKAEEEYGAYLGLDRPFETIASVDATEHSVQCSFNNDDMAYFKHCMHTASPNGILSLVSDGYDFWKLVTEVLPELKEDILSRDGKIVIRPDSGDPANVICGKDVQSFNDERDFTDYVDEIMGEDCGQGMCCDDVYEDVVLIGGEVRKVTCSIEVISAKQDRGDRLYWIETVKVVSNEPSELTPVQKGLVEVLYDMFGGTKTEEGFKMLDEHIGTIYGDSITLARQKDIYERLHAKGFAIGNVVLGIGSYSYQYVTRDTHGSAVKATNMVLDGVDTAISKEVKGDASKKSAKGRLVVYKDENGEYGLRDTCTLEEFEASDNLLEPVWSNGVWMKVQDLQNVRANVSDTLKRLA